MPTYPFGFAVPKVLEKSAFPMATKLSKWISKHLPASTVANHLGIDGIEISTRSEPDFVSVYMSMADLQADMRAKIASYPINSLLIDEQARCPTAPAELTELGEEHFESFASMVKGDREGLQTLAASLEPALAHLDPDLSKTSLSLIRANNRYNRALAILSALHRDPNARLFRIQAKKNELCGLVGLVRHEQATHLIAWIHPNYRNRHLTTATIEQVLKHRFDSEPTAMIHATPSDQSPASHKLLKRLQFRPPVEGSYRYTLTRTDFTGC